MDVVRSDPGASLLESQCIDDDPADEHEEEEGVQTPYGPLELYTKEEVEWQSGIEI